MKMNTELGYVPVTFNELDVYKRQVHYNTNTFCRINRRTTTQCHDKISTGSFICSHTILYIGNSRIGFWNAFRIERVHQVADVTSVH